MDHHLIRASQRLNETSITIALGGFQVNVYWFRVMVKEGNWHIRRHSHATYEFHFCAQGDCLVHTDSGSFLVKEGFFYVSPPGHHHAQYHANTGEYVEYSLNCSIQKTRAFSSSMDDDLKKVFSFFSSGPAYPVMDCFGVLPLFRLALEEAEQRSMGYKWVLHNIVPQILVASARAIEQEQQMTATSAGGRGANTLLKPNFRISKIEEFIQANIEKNITPGDIARHLNLSGKQVSRIVIAYKGFPAKKLITRMKLGRAKRLLTDSDMSIKEIARYLGFSSEYYFSSVFRLHEGIPPGTFRSIMEK